MCPCYTRQQSTTPFVWFTFNVIEINNNIIVHQKYCLSRQFIQFRWSRVYQQRYEKSALLHEEMKYSTQCFFFLDRLEMRSRYTWNDYVKGLFIYYVTHYRGGGLAKTLRSVMGGAGLNYRKINSPSKLWHHVSIWRVMTLLTIDSQTDDYWIFIHIKHGNERFTLSKQIS